MYPHFNFDFMLVFFKMWSHLYIYRCIQIMFFWSRIIGFPEIDIGLYRNDSFGQTGMGKQYWPETVWPWSIMCIRLNLLGAIHGKAILFKFYGDYNKFFGSPNFYEFYCIHFLVRMTMTVQGIFSSKTTVTTYSVVLIYHMYAATTILFLNKFS